MKKKLGFGMIGLGEIAWKSTGWVIQETENTETDESGNGDEADKKKRRKKK